MNIKKGSFIFLSLLIIVLIVFRLKSNKEESAGKVYTYNKEQAITVNTEKITLQPIGSDFSFTGIFEPNRESKLSAEQQGKINAIYCDLGSYVSKGQKLVQLDNALLQQQLNALDVQIANAKTDYNVQLNAIDVQIANAKAEYNVQLNANQIQIDALKADVKRLTVLAQADAIQGVQLEKAQQQLSTTENQRVAILNQSGIKNAENQRAALLNQSGIKNAEAQRKSIVEQISKTSIYAPFSGVITAKLSEIGSFAAPGVPILQLSEIGTLRFSVNVSEKDLPFFQIGQSKAIQLDAMPDKKIQGKVAMVGSKSNMGNSFPIQFAVQNMTGNPIKAGMFGKVEMYNHTEEMGIIIPASVLSGTAEQPKIYIVKDGKASLINITISKRTEDKVVVSEGLQQGDILITNGFVNLFDGANVGTTPN